MHTRRNNAILVLYKCVNKQQRKNKLLSFWSALTKAARNTLRTESFAAMVTTCIHTSWTSLALSAFPPDPVAPPLMGGTLDWWTWMWGRRRGMDSRERCKTAVSRAFQSEENRPSTAEPNICISGNEYPV